MEAKELRIGNFVFVQSSKLVKENEGERSALYRVENVNLQSGKKYDPVPLTKEWLFKFGFDDKSIMIDEDYNIIHVSIDDNSFFLGGSDSCTDSHYYMGKIKYVHQLQNLYFSLTGKELTIK